MNDTILLDHGEGGAASGELLRRVFLPRLGDPGTLEDAAVVAAGSGEGGEDRGDVQGPGQQHPRGAEDLERARLEFDTAHRANDLARMSELQYGRIPELEKQLE